MRPFQILESLGGDMAPVRLCPGGQRRLSARDLSPDAGLNSAFASSGRLPATAACQHRGAVDDRGRTGVRTAGRVPDARHSGVGLLQQSDSDRQRERLSRP